MERNDVKGMLTLFASVATIAAGCGIDKPSGSSGAGSGTLQVALTATTPEGTVYRVEHAILDIYNFSGLCTSFPCVSVPGDDPIVDVALTVSVNPFDYSLSLEDGWTVSRVAEDGTETPVAATLLTNFIPFTIKPDRKTPVILQFQIGELVATTGTGTVTVKPEFLEPLIDDFEDGDSQLAPFGGRNGQWFTFNDGSGVEVPPPGAPIVPEVLDTSANYWLHITGSGFGAAGLPLPSGIYSYGAGVTANLVTDPATGFGKPYNASAYSGVGFTFVMKAPLNAPVILSFYVHTSATVPVDQGGTCAFNCFDGFGVNGPVPAVSGGFTFTGVVPWEVMHQVGYGTPATFNPSTIMSVNWLVSFADNGQPLSSNLFDLRLDDIAFAPGGFAVPSAGGGGAADAGPPPDPGKEDGGLPLPGDDGGLPPPPGKPLPGGPLAPLAAKPAWTW